MKAIVAHALGPPESFVLEERPATPPQGGQVRVRLHSAGISFVDLLVAAGEHQYKPALPFVPGSEFSGVVMEAGPGVQTVMPGDRVCGGAMGGVFAEEVTLPAERVQRLPPHVSMEPAAVLRASYLTAWYALVERGGLRAGETVLVLGAAGAVGTAACQLARHFGAQVVAAASSPAKRAFALSQGASHTVDLTAADWGATIGEVTGGCGVNVVVDPVGGSATEAAFRALAYKGRHLVVGFAAGAIPSLPANLPLLKGAALVGVLASHFTDREPKAAAAARQMILDLFVNGAISPPVAAVYPLIDFVAAMRAVRSGDRPGRVLLDMA